MDDLDRYYFIHLDNNTFLHLIVIHLYHFMKIKVYAERVQKKKQRPKVLKYSVHILEYIHISCKHVHIQNSRKRKGHII